MDIPKKKEIPKYKSGVHKYKLCSCGFKQSYPIPHTHDMTAREIEIRNAYEIELDIWERKGYNQCHDEMREWFIKRLNEERDYHLTKDGRKTSGMYSSGIVIDIFDKLIEEIKGVEE